MKALIFLVTLMAAVSAQAQTVYRCGPEGRVYSQTPCPQGKAVDVSDDRSAEQRAAAQARAREDRDRGDSLERERLNREAGKPASAGKIDGRPAPPLPVEPKAKGKSPKKKKAKAKHESDDFKAVAPVKKTNR